MEDTVSSREINRRERTKALEESCIVHRDEKMIVAVPLTQYASCWWGKGTRWCTASDKDNYFDQYNKESPLLVINLLESGEKFQLWVSKNTLQFMDASDSEVECNLIEKYWCYLGTILQWAVEQNGCAIGYLPKHLKTVELCRVVVEQNGRALKFVPENFKTIELCKIAVQQNGEALGFTPRHLKTVELCRIAVEQNGTTLRFVPGNFKTAELCSIAVKQDGRAIRSLPEPLITYDLCRIAVEQNEKALEYIPEHWITPELQELSSRKKIEEKANWHRVMLSGLREKLVQPNNTPALTLSYSFA